MELVTVRDNPDKAKAEDAKRRAIGHYCDLLLGVRGRECSSATEAFNIISQLYGHDAAVAAREAMRY